MPATASTWPNWKQTAKAAGSIPRGRKRERRLRPCSTEGRTAPSPCSAPRRIAVRQPSNCCPQSAATYPRRCGGRRCRKRCPAMLVTRCCGRLVVSELSAAATRSPDAAELVPVSEARDTTGAAISGQGMVNSPAQSSRGPLRLVRPLPLAAAPTSEARFRHGLRVHGPGRQCVGRPPGRVPCRCGRASQA